MNLRRRAVRLITREETATDAELYAYPRGGRATNYSEDPMGFDQYHEPPAELSASVRTFARLCASLGYDSHDQEVVRLYLEESFSFRVATPEAAVALAGPAGS